MDEFIFQLLMVTKRVRFRWRNRGRLEKATSLAETLRSKCNEAVRLEWSTYHGLYNVGLFVVLVDRDISAYSESIFFAKSEWHRQFYARGLAVLLYEMAEDLPQLLGKEYRSWLKEIGVGETWLEALNSIHKKLSAFRNSHAVFLQEVRNYVGAHRHHNAVAQLDSMNRIGPLEIYALAGDMTDSVREIISFYIRLLQYMHNPIVVIRQIEKKQPKLSGVDGAG